MEKNEKMRSEQTRCKKRNGNEIWERRVVNRRDVNSRDVKNRNVKAEM